MDRSPTSSKRQISDIVPGSGYAGGLDIRCSYEDEGLMLKFQKARRKWHSQFFFKNTDHQLVIVIR